MSPLDLNAIPNPANSPIEKLLPDTMWENIEPRIRGTLSENPTRDEILRAFSYYDRVMADYIRRHERALTEWANTHTHPGGGGEVISPGDFQEVWEYVTPMPTARYNQAAAFLGGRLHVVGGYGTQVHERYDPVTDTWDTLASVPLATNNPARMTSDGSFLYWGTGTRLERYNPVTDSWSTLTTAPNTYSTGGILEYVGDNTIYSVSGFTGGYAGSYDLVTTVWAEHTALSSLGSNQGAGYYKGKLYAARSVLNIYDIETDTWSVGPALPVTGYETMAGSMVKNLLIIAGGSVDTPDDPVDQTSFFNAESNAWTYSTASLNQARVRHDIASNGETVYAVGGNDGSGTALATVERLL